MKKVQITETVLRDANQSLMATRLPYSDFADILPEMNKAGYYSVECWGGATFDSCIRFLDEDPWERLRILRKELPHQKLQMLFRGQNILGYKHYPDDVVRKFVEYSVKNGIDIEFVMSKKPNKKWAVAKDDIAPSVSTEGKTVAYKHGMQL